MAIKVWAHGDKPTAAQINEYKTVLDAAKAAQSPAQQATATRIEHLLDISDAAKDSDRLDQSIGWVLRDIEDLVGRACDRRAARCEARRHGSGAGHTHTCRPRSRRARADCDVASLQGAGWFDQAVQSRDRRDASG